MALAALEQAQKVEIAKALSRIEGKLFVAFQTSCNEHVHEKIGGLRMDLRHLHAALVSGMTENMHNSDAALEIAKASQPYARSEGSWADGQLALKHARRNAPALHRGDIIVDAQPLLSKIASLLGHFGDNAHGGKASPRDPDVEALETLRTALGADTLTKNEEFAALAKQINAGRGGRQ